MTYRSRRNRTMSSSSSSGGVGFSGLLTPPLKLVQEWASEFYGAAVLAPGEAMIAIATEAARWGAHQELEACCKWLPKLPPWSADDLRRYRRPKPPSLKEQALKEMDKLDEMWDVTSIEDKSLDIIRRAIESLPD